MVSEQELQEKMMIYRTLEARLGALTRQRDMVNSKLTEIMYTISSIDEIEKNRENLLFKLGGEAYAHGNIADKDNILVDIGTGIILEKTREDGKKLLNRRREEMENVMKEIQSNVSQLSDALGQLGPEINEMMRLQDSTVK